MPPPPPPVTILLCVHNESAFLPQAVESVLGQTFGDYEFLVIDDGSTDGTWDYLTSVRDPRVRLLRNPRNFGLTCSLNRGLDAARGAYLARMDGDDFAEPDRLAAQVTFLNEHPEVGVVGSSRTLIDEAGHFVAEARATEGDLAIRWKCLLGNPFAHPTVMMRRNVLSTHGLRYNDVRRAEDYDLWPRLLAHTKGANLPAPLLRYRLRERATIDKGVQIASHDRVAHSAIRQLVPQYPITFEEVAALRGRFGGFSVRDPALDPTDPKWVATYLRLLDTFADAHANEPGIAQFHDHQRQSIGGGTAAAA